MRLVQEYLCLTVSQQFSGIESDMRTKYVVYRVLAMAIDHVHWCRYEHSIMTAFMKMYLYHDYLIYMLFNDM